MFFFAFDFEFEMKRMKEERFFLVLLIKNWELSTQFYAAAAVVVTTSAGAVFNIYEISLAFFSNQMQQKRRR